MLLAQLIVLQIIVFAGVIFFLKRILYSDTESAVNRLDKTYQDLLAKQKELQTKIDQAEKDYKEKRDEATAIAEKLKQKALDETRTKEDTILKEAKAEADEMVKKARSSCEKIRREIEKDVTMNNLDYVQKLLSASLTEDIIATMHRELIRTFISKKDSFDFSTVPPELTGFVIRHPLPIDEKTKKELHAVVKEKLGRDISYEEEEDPKLIAGIALAFDTLVLEGSFASMINDAVVAEKRKIELEA